MHIDGRKFRFLRSSDLERDGLCLEAHEDDKQVAEVFYSDVDRSTTFTAFANDLPTALVLYMVTEGLAQITPVSESDSE